jgi:hypothetical protein
MNGMIILNGLFIGGCIGWLGGNYLGFGLAMTFVTASFGGVAGLGLAWWVQKYWY